MAVLVGSGNTLDISNSCFQDNNFRGFGSVVVLGDATYRVQGNYGTQDDEDLSCQFIAKVRGLTGEQVVSCVNYDQNQCLVSAVPDNTDASPDPSEQSEEVFECGVCGPGSVLSFPEKVVEIPAGFVEGYTEASCIMIDGAIKDNLDQLNENFCSQLQDYFKEDCGCISIADDTADDDDDSSSAAPVVQDNNNNSPTTEESTEACTVCGPDMVITRPGAFVAIPEGVISKLPFFVTCQLMEKALVANADLVEAQICRQIREGYKTPCGCQMEADVPSVSKPDGGASQQLLDDDSGTNNQKLNRIGVFVGILLCALLLS